MFLIGVLPRRGTISKTNRTVVVVICGRTTPDADRADGGRHSGFDPRLGDPGSKSVGDGGALKTTRFVHARAAAAASSHRHVPAISRPPRFRRPETTRTRRYARTAIGLRGPRPRTAGLGSGEAVGTWRQTWRRTRIDGVPARRAV